MRKRARAAPHRVGVGKHQVSPRINVHPHPCVWPGMATRRKQAVAHGLGGKLERKWCETRIEVCQFFCPRACEGETDVHQSLAPHNCVRVPKSVMPRRDTNFPPVTHCGSMAVNARPGTPILHAVAEGGIYTSVKTHNQGNT